VEGHQQGRQGLAPRQGKPGHALSPGSFFEGG
jgi:hypothetical protein